MTDFFAQDNSGLDSNEITDEEYRIGFGNCNGGGLPLIAAKFNSLLNRFSRFLVPSGTIVLWNGTLQGSVITDIPDGWLLCDGSNGTPNLGDRVIIGHGQSYNVGLTGGQETRTIPASGGTVEVAAGTGTTVSASNHTHNVTVVQPFYVLAYIMKA